MFSRRDPKIQVMDTDDGLFPAAATIKIQIYRHALSSSHTTAMSLPALQPTIDLFCRSLYVYPHV